MRTRVAMVCCKGPHRTPWMSLQGGESRLRILHMMEGESVIVEDGATTHEFNSCGEFPFRPAGPQVRFIKERRPEVDGSPTFVEVIYDV